MIDSFLKYLQFEKRSSEHTVTSYRRDLTQLQGYLNEDLGALTLEKASYTDLRSWIVNLVESGLSPVSINRKTATLKSFYKFLLVRGFVKDNPTNRLKPLRTEKKLPSFVRESEMNNLLDKIEFGSDFEGRRDKLLLELLYASGIRLSELINLKDTDINVFQGTIKVLGKRNKERLIPISQFLVDSIRDYQVLRRAAFPNRDLLLITDKGDQLYPMMVNRKVKNYLDQVTTISKKSPHVLRHTFATHLLNKGADLNAVKDLLGHTSLAATQVYTHNSMEKLKAVFDQAHPKA